MAISQYDPAGQTANSRALRESMDQIALAATHLRERLCAAEAVAQIAADHLPGCGDPELTVAVREWWHAIGFEPPATQETADEASWEARSGR